MSVEVGPRLKNLPMAQVPSRRDLLTSRSFARKLESRNLSARPRLSFRFKRTEDHTSRGAHM